MLDEGLWAEIKLGDEHLQLFAERNALGVQASVYNVRSKNWIAPSETVADIAEAQATASAHANRYLMDTLGLKLPALEWKKSRSA